MPPLALACLLACVLAIPAPGAAQRLRGRVLEDGRDVPVAGALVSLVDRDGARRARTVADSLGRFVLTPPEAGEYVVEAVRLGYRDTRSPLFAMKAEGSVAFDLLMTPEPIGLEGLEVSVVDEAEDLLRSFGQTPARLKDRWIDREEIERMRTPGFAKDLIRRRAVAGVWVEEYDDSPVGGPLCVHFRRRERQCALNVLNGAVVDPEIAGMIDPHDIEAIALLDPVDASTFYGTQAGGGAVLIWTR